MIDFQHHSALELARLVRRGEVSADELHDACLALIADRDPEIGAVASLGTPPPADADGPFAGVPFAVKELLAVPGLPWTMGSRLCAANPAGPPSPYVRRLLDLGLRIVCTTRSSEFGLLGSTETLLHGATHNPWGAGLSAAGSSGGAAALVAAGALPMAHAGDGGGSIRVPASVTGLFGFKPTNGRLLEATPPDGLGGLVADHCISRSVADSAALFAATQRDPAKPVTGPSARRLRIGVVERTLLGSPPEPAVRTELHRARELCDALGHTTTDVDLTAVDGQAVSDGFFLLAGLTFAGLADTMTPLLGRAPGPEELEPFTLELIEQARGLLPEAPRALLQAMHAAGAAYLAATAGCDVVLSPTVARPPWPLGTLDPRAGRETLIRRTEAIVGYTPIHNVTGSPAMSVPLGRAGELPVGMQFAAAPGADELLLGLAFELEDAAPWRDRRPALVAAA